MTLQRTKTRKGRELGKIRSEPKQARRGSATAVGYRHKVLDPTVKLYTLLIGLSFVLIGDNVRPLTAAIIDDFLEIEGIVGGMAITGFCGDRSPYNKHNDTLYTLFEELNTLLTLNEVLVERGITYPRSSAFLHPSTPVITIAWKSNEGKKLFRLRTARGEVGPQVGHAWFKVSDYVRNRDFQKRING
ncbi:hypothetical protein TNCV_4594491 [Trichonephila clavipes]|uniref:Uncharacterized protein n=1 Tax=Trichonephila clavipes TaxID=2585209 RepID=A0A8X7BKI6_TRICX|nr:hypothetical protein TNCV_4594491 [Trichonephila clavipes]